MAVLLPSSPSPSNCATCRNIHKLFYDPENAQTVKLGSFEEALSDPCDGHKSLVQAFVAKCRHDEYGEGPEDLGIERGDDNATVQIVDSVNYFGPTSTWDLLLAKITSGQDHPGTGRVLDPDWVDLERLRQWKHDCLTLHGESCHNPMRIWDTRPAWLVDVKQRCLVPGRQAGGYVALSYTYGAYRGMHIDAGMLVALQEPLALDRPEIARLVPPIIRHAMYLTWVVQELHLWTDALCVPHHDPKITQAELRMMGAIYASAVATIVAADGDASVGLQGLRGVSDPRRLEQNMFPVGNERLLVRNAAAFSTKRGLPYYERGWTYQEYMMSPRRIIFESKEIHWECSCSVWHEELVYGAEADKYIEPRLNLILSGFPDLDALSHIIAMYNDMRLRHEDDALPGVTGLLSVLSRCFKGGFLYGIPVMFFDRVLGWKPYYAHVNLLRRTASKRPEENRLSPAGLPSWSWIGWQGLVSCADGEATKISSEATRREETIPITKWYTGPSPKTPPSKRQRIRSTWFEDRDSYKNTTKPLPPGWTRHEFPTTGPWSEKVFLYPDGCGRSFYTHAATPPGLDLGDMWHYPFPVAEINDTTPPSLPEQTEYLFCETSKASLWGYQAGDFNAVTLVDGQRNVVGSLVLHNDDFLHRFPPSPSEEILGLQVELVAIHKSRIYEKTWDADKQRHELPPRKHDVYVVLWVDWKDGVAYRLARGEVAADAWDHLPHENISLVLG
ncbi:hypothetical protein PpBr36_06884 [Pyricularia pennisetigena]|uniref:hypothetical protein n=1 Tax=Pyricularia pennisetigena TaxID=1578925 RepID=UPI001154B6AF|nr:hypothetical protein PpBr36_06884 [Pyricularia pennisetigena]TLS26079.1 hypothetical protein PpBr36_06884 [Pyricularia pennisetigena]